MIKLLRLSLRLFRSSWRLAWLAALFAAALSGAATANEQPNWNEERSNLKSCILRQISYIAKLSELLREQKLSFPEYEKLIADLEKSNQIFDQKIESLNEQLTNSEISEANSQKELAELKSLYGQLTEKHEQLLNAWNEYRQEAESQIEDIKRERDRARRRLKWTVPGIGLAFLFGALLGAFVF